MISVLVPWRPQQSRVPAFDAVVAWYRRELPDAVVRTVDTDDAVFNLARCRNTGVRSIPDPREVVVINDADTLPEGGPLRAAIAAAAASDRVQLPYTDYHWLGVDGSEQYRSGRPLPECDFELVRGACSGIYVTTPDTWFSHGGQDERFRGWGFEDAAWYLAHETLLGGPPQRHDGRVFALHHRPEARSGANYDANAALMARYAAAAADRVAMREVVGSPRPAVATTPVAG